MTNYKIVVADDHLLMSDGLSMLVTDNNLGTVVAKAQNGKQLLEILNSHKIDMILIDVDMPLVDRLKAAEIIRSRYPSIKILVVTQHNSIELMKKFELLGVEGYLLKSCDRMQLIEAIQKIKGGEKDFPFLQI
ncbi:response regulator transcription factor [Segetibacter sp. 3557_3]|uniref:response regulator n=1 Tax=Segetibacter sp. 3557_3 TaxID=2547429 RepID=UPI001058F472|nr:response regulator transcription factor [Segetibacter sp. 3557_3]TDH18392.1 response regulator transcription factor [Segetibacter sp. 3557_3]